MKLSEKSSCEINLLYGTYGRVGVVTHTHIIIVFVLQLPELLHTKEKGRKKMGQFVLSMIGLSVGFAILLVIAIYEEELDSLIE